MPSRRRVRHEIASVLPPRPDIRYFSVRRRGACALRTRARAAAAGAPRPRRRHAAPAKKAAAAPKAAAAAHSPSYSLGLSMGEQLKSNFVSADSVNTTALAQGVHDALTGKAAARATPTCQNINKIISTAVNGAGDANHRLAAKFLAENAKKPGVVTTASGLQYKVLTPGSGEPPKPTDEVTVNYKGTLLDGTEFDSSYKRGQPAKFPLEPRDPRLVRGRGAHEARREVRAVRAAAPRVRPAPAAALADSARIDADLRGGADQREGGPAAPPRPRRAEPRRARPASRQPHAGPAGARSPLQPSAFAPGLKRMGLVTPRRVSSRSSFSASSAGCRRARTAARRSSRRPRAAGCAGPPAHPGSAG